MNRQIFHALQEGATSVSNLLLKTYKRLSLTDEEMMLIIHLLSFQQVGNRFPTIQQLENRLSMPSMRLIQLLQKLIKEGWLTIDEEVDKQTGLRYENYNLEPLYQKLAQCLKDEELAVMETVASSRETAVGTAESTGLYNQFEQAFGRPLSPFEIETLHIWVEQDKYSEELIVAALREAAAVGKLYIRYIDRILLEWQRQKISSAEEARNYSLRFRRHSTPRDQRQPL
ncbi:DnaD domain protein [Brevibacillus humidisoli]|uniref:DnaD domain protein n=1 Tax=Brevibacillus humidisoli TaxID=2895522 RepID=UPI001E3298D3|nr:DnaD domain protein [Brevibacillus humidisoli]UFJ42731.1 DnaD domain protein [Brevibacillus humidisoli]